MLALEGLNRSAHVALDLAIVGTLLIERTPIYVDQPIRVHVTGDPDLAR